MTAADPRRKQLDDLYGFAQPEAADDSKSHQVAIARDSIGPVIVNPTGPVHVATHGTCPLGDPGLCQASEAARIHLQWQVEHLRDQEFVQATRIAATGNERVLLQKLLALGAKVPHVREVWAMGLLYTEADALMIKRPKSFPWIGAISFCIVAFASAPLGAQAILMEGKSPLWLLPFALFSAGIGYAGWCAKTFIQPWRLVTRLRPFVDALNSDAGK